MDINAIKESLDRVLSGQDFGDEIPDYSSVQNSISLLERMSEVENSSIAVFDLYRKEFVTIRSKYGSQVGVDKNAARAEGLAYYISIMHPDDAPMVLDTYERAFRFTFDLPVEEKKDYKTILNFRLGFEGRYYNFVQQLVTLELTQGGRVWLGLSISDMLTDNSRFDRACRRLINLKNNRCYLFNDDQLEGAWQNLTSREIEVLSLVSKGFLSKEIADRLFLSVNTVNNHRQRILEKINASNTSEAISYARNMGLL